MAFSHVGFEVSSDPIWPPDQSIYYGVANDYNIEYATKPFNSIRFETLGEGIKNGECEQVSIHVLSTDAILNPLQVYLKSKKRETLVLDLWECFHFYQPNKKFNAPGSDFNSEIGIEFFPNPFKDYINVRYSGEESDRVEFRLLDLHGRVLKRQFDKTDFTWDIEDLANGTYYILAISNNSVIISKVLKD